MKLTLPDRAALRDPVTRSATAADLPEPQADDQGPASFVRRPRTRRDIHGITTAAHIGPEEWGSALTR
jgi:hypothetical protein